MKYSELSRKFAFAQKIFTDSSTTPDKIRSLTGLLHGIHPKIDTALKEVNRSLSTLEKIDKTQVIELTAEALPETTPQERQRKKALLLLLRWWNELKGEVTRIEKEMIDSDGKVNLKTANYGGIIAATKGPLAVITIIAIGLVFLKSTSVEVKITNSGCAPLEPVAQIPNFIPGFKLPIESIPDGTSAYAVLPPLHLTIDGTTPRILKITGYNLNYSFHLAGSNIAPYYNGSPLLGKITQVKLNKETTQEITIRCER